MATLLEQLTEYNKNNLGGLYDGAALMYLATVYKNNPDKAIQEMNALYLKRLSKQSGSQSSQSSGSGSGSGAGIDSGTLPIIVGAEDPNFETGQNNIPDNMGNKNNLQPQEMSTGTKIFLFGMLGLALFAISKK